MYCERGGWLVSGVEIMKRIVKIRNIDPGDHGNQDKVDSKLYIQFFSGWMLRSKSQGRGETEAYGSEAKYWSWCTLWNKAETFLSWLMK